MDTHIRRPAAVLWDMDGTLIDSEPYWIAAETEFAARYGVEWTHEDGLAMVGNSLSMTAVMLQERGIAVHEDEIIAAILAQVVDNVKAHLPWQPDAKALLDEVIQAGIPCALVTMSYRVLADAMIDHIPGVFSVVITGDEVERGKPHPDPYLIAAAQLGVSIADCVAIEDSPAGTQSAHASGAATLAVLREAPVEPLPGMSRVTSLAGIGVAGLAELVDGRVLDQTGARR
ncbi:MAG: hydrolase [Actinobacteria bacterium HGW-Actinobacteria-4]|nr:MAG: hydrolase [Actinobacteria bacterium HGW-Actinobacteria-4]